MSYLAFARFTYDPSLSWEAFLQEEVGPRLGGDVIGSRFLEIVALLDSEQPIERAELRRLHAEAADSARHLDYDAGRRWGWLGQRLAKREMSRR